MSFTTAPTPSASLDSVDHGVLSASEALAWKFYAFGALAIVVAGVLGTIIYLGCFRLRKPAASPGDVENNQTASGGNYPTKERRLSEGSDESMFTSTISTLPPPSSTITLVSLPAPAYIPRGALSHGGK